MRSWMSFSNPVHASRGNQTWGSNLSLESFVVFRERHAPRLGERAGPCHWHIALRASSCFRFCAYKRASSVNRNLASHWSCTHDGYWSAVRYGYVPTPKKPQGELDPNPYKWSREGHHPPLCEVCHEPTTATALARRREQQMKRASERGALRCA